MTYLSKELNFTPSQTPRGLARIRLLEATSHGSWDTFVKAHPQGTFFHLSAWKTLLEKTFNLETYYLYTEVDGTITGLLPLARVKSWLFSDALISVPFCVYGGPLAIDESDRNRLIQEACTIAQNLNVDYLELKQIEDEVQVGFAQTQYVRFKKALPDSPEGIMQSIPRKQRAMVRKAIKKDLHFVIEDNVEHFYPLYCQSLKSLGTPVLAKSYYRNLLSLMGAQADVLTVFKGSKPVASVLNFYYQNEVLPFYAGGNHLSRALSAHDFMYWSLMNHALEKGCTQFDFGRSKVDTGSYRFKKHWGFEPQALHYRNIPIMCKEAPNISPTNPKYQWLIAIWRQMPLAVLNRVGPFVARRIG